MNYITVHNPLLFYTNPFCHVVNLGRTLTNVSFITVKPENFLKPSFN